jgi:hypothetical protein
LIPKSITKTTDTCGNEFMDPPLPPVQSNSTFDVLGTCNPNLCDVTATRNTYTAAPNKVYKMIWMVFRCPGFQNFF